MHLGERENRASLVIDSSQRTSKWWIMDPTQLLATESCCQRKIFKVNPLGEKKKIAFWWIIGLSPNYMQHNLATRQDFLKWTRLLLEKIFKVDHRTDVAYDPMQWLRMLLCWVSQLFKPKKQVNGMAAWFRCILSPLTWIEWWRPYPTSSGRGSVLACLHALAGTMSLAASWPPKDS